MSALLAALRTRLGAPPPLDEAFQTTIEQIIEQTEDECGAELVLVVRPQSGSYRDVCWLFGAGVAWVALAVMIFAHFDIYPLVVLLDTMLLFFFGGWVAGRTSLRRWLCPQSRLDQQAAEGMRLALYEEGILETPNATGILVYWTRLEKRIEAYADTGVLRQLPPAAWHAFEFALRQAEHVADPRSAIIAALEALRPTLQQHVPIPEGHVRILPNRPRTTP